MCAPDAIAPGKLAKLIVTARCPTLLDNRRDPVRAEDPRLVPGARTLTDDDLAPDSVDRLMETLSGPVVAVYAEGPGCSQGLAALQRSRGIAAEHLEGGHESWRAARQPLVDPGRINAHDGHGRGVRVPRARPKVDWPTNRTGGAAWRM